jgi:dUTP pyrophosphatase
MLKIKVVNKGHQPLPQYATAQSAGMDLRANIDEPITLKPLERRHPNGFAYCSACRL